MARATLVRVMMTTVNLARGMAVGLGIRGGTPKHHAAVGNIEKATRVTAGIMTSAAILSLAGEDMADGSAIPKAMRKLRGAVGMKGKTKGVQRGPLVMTMTIVVPLVQVVGAAMVGGLGIRRDIPRLPGADGKIADRRWFLYTKVGA